MTTVEVLAAITGQSFHRRQVGCGCERKEGGSGQDASWILSKACAENNARKYIEACAKASYCWLVVLSRVLCSENWILCSSEKYVADLCATPSVISVLTNRPPGGEI